MKFHRRWAGTVVLFVAALSCLSTVPAWAASVSINALAMNQIFSQPSFGTTPITITFNPIVTVNGPLVINNSTDLTNLFNLAPAQGPTVNMFFVDSINWCGTSGSGIVGCGAQPGNMIALDSAAAAGGAGPVINGHELGHNLDLAHTATAPNPNDNLMNPTVYGNGSTILTTAQVATILTSPLVQLDVNGNRFINITPVLVAAVPLPAALPLALSGLSAIVMLGVGARRRKAPIG